MVQKALIPGWLCWLNWVLLLVAQSAKKGMSFHATVIRLCKVFFFFLIVWLSITYIDDAFISQSVKFAWLAVSTPSVCSDIGHYYLFSHFIIVSWLLAVYFHRVTEFILFEILCLVTCVNFFCSTFWSFLWRLIFHIYMMFLSWCS